MTLGLAGVAIAAGVGTPAQAWPWRSEPQPLVEDESAIWSDADSPLAWDPGSRTLWYLASGKLSEAYWSRGTFKHYEGSDAPLATAGLLVDPSLHFLYSVDAAGIPRVTGLNTSANDGPLGTDPVTKLLAVDSRRHTVFAYDAVAGGIRQYTFGGTKVGWKSELIATGLGTAEEAGAFDGVNRVLYTTHETVDAAVPRHGLAGTVGDPTGLGAWKPWPLVATTWKATGWTSQVIDETGVPQQPAVRMVDHRVFYAQRDEGELVHYYQPAWARQKASLGSRAGWSGADTYEDNNSYAIRKPVYPVWWPGSTGSISVIWTQPPRIPPVPIAPQKKLQGPITIVPYYEPVWTDVALPQRLVRFRAVVNARQSRLIQHRTWSSGEVVRTQTGQRLAGYFYRDANGVLAMQGNSSFRSSSLTLVDGPTYPVLDATFDPLHPPATFGALAGADVNFYAYYRDTTLTYSLIVPYSSSLPSGFATRTISPTACLDPNAPWVGAQLRLPTAVRTTNFGHSYAVTTQNQTGGRYRNFFDTTTSQAASSQLALDPGSGMTFYTQATAPTAQTVQLDLDFSATLTAFVPAPDNKFLLPAQKVWIVTVY